MTDNQIRLLFNTHKRVLEEIISRLCQLERMLVRTAGLDERDREILMSLPARTADGNSRADASIDGARGHSSGSSAGGDAAATPQ